MQLSQIFGEFRQLFVHLKKKTNPTSQWIVIKLSWWIVSSNELPFAISLTLLNYTRTAWFYMRCPLYTHTHTSSNHTNCGGFTNSIDAITTVRKKQLECDDLPNEPINNSKLFLTCHTIDTFFKNRFHFHFFAINKIQMDYQFVIEAANKRPRVLEEYEFNENVRIGRGSYGQVYKAREKLSNDPNQFYALKEVELTHYSPSTCREIAVCLTTSRRSPEMAFHYSAKFSFFSFVALSWNQTSKYYGFVESVFFIFGTKGALQKAN